MSKKTKPDIKQLRAIGHKLNPVVTIAGKGLSETVSAELDRALTDHELIKVKIAVGSREARAELIREDLQANRRRDGTKHWQRHRPVAPLRHA